MRRILSISSVVMLVAALSPVAGATTAHDLRISTARAAVAPDGTTAGEFTDFVMTFRNPDPDVDGISLFEGGTVTVTLPDEFANTGGGPNFLALLQGWPQSVPAPPPDFIWTTVVSGNTVTATMNADFQVGDFGPGFKQVHALLDGFRNPAPGDYPVDLVIQPDPKSSETYHGTGTVRIIPESLPSVNAVSVFSGGGPPPPFNNAIFQTVYTGDAANPVGLYLWEAGSSIADGVVNPFLGVELEMLDLRRGRLVQGDRVVGAVRITAPAGADDHALTTTGPSVLGTTAVTVIDAGVLVTQLFTDPDVAGDYTISFRMLGGNTQRLFVTAR